MKALVYKGPKELELMDYAVPIRKDGEVLIKVKACGICGSDFEGYLGKTGRRIAPMVMGHEFAGEVVETAESSDFKAGERVVVHPKFYCGECDYCRNGLTNICPSAEFLGVMDKDGGFAEYLSAPERFVFKFDDCIDYTEASMVEPLAVAYRATTKIDEELIRKANHIMVIGAGTIGALVLQVLKLKGAKHVIVSDLSNFRLERAKEMGADEVINPGTVEFKAEIAKMTGGKMVDYAFEAVGVSATAAQSLEALKIGGTVVWVGNAQKIIETNMQKIVTTELTIKGTYIYTEDDFLKCLKLVEEKKIDFAPLISIETGLENGVDMFKRLTENKDGKLIKIILKN